MLYDMRHPEYEKADVAVEATARDPEAVADDILQRIEDRVWSENL